MEIANNVHHIRRAIHIMDLKIAELNNAVIYYII